MRKREFYVAPIRPVIDKVKLERPRRSAQLKMSKKLRESAPEPLSRSSNLMIVIQGRRLQGERTLVRIGRADITPQTVTDEGSHGAAFTTNPEESDALRAGVQGVQVVHQSQERTTSSREALSLAPESEVESNVMPLVLCPTILNGNEGVATLNAEEQDEDVYRGNVTAQVDVTIVPEQRVFLLFNGIEHSKPTSSGQPAALLIQIRFSSRFKTL